MSIRRKLFYAFIGVVAVPLVIAVLLSRSYLARARGDLDQRFVERATQAFRTMHDNTRNHQAALCLHVHHAAQDPGLIDGDLDIKVVPTEGDTRGQAFQILAGMPRVLADLRSQYPEVVGVELRSDDAVLFSDLKPAVTIPAEIRASQGSLDCLFTELDGRQFVLDRDEDNDVLLAVEFAPRLLVHPTPLYQSGSTFYLVPDARRPWHVPFIFWHQGADGDRLVKQMIIPLAAIGDELPSGGEMASVRDSNWVRWRLYSAPASENDPESLAAGARLVAMAPEDEIYAPLTWFRVEVYGALFASLLVAAWLAYFLSGRLVGAVDRIRHGVEALSRGEWAQLDKLSEDELGGGLVESVNQMAAALAERTRREEIEGWRRLVRVLSHEINNTLGPVRSVAVTVRDQIAGRVGETDAAEDLRLAFQLIVDRTDALTAFIAGYAELAKLPDPARSDTDFNAVVDGAARLFREDADKSSIALAVRLDGETGRAYVDAGQVERVVINLVKNAVEAVASHGDLPSAEVVVATARRGNSVELTVEDNGPGIALEARRHLFVPYFTTKKGGSGIGLALVRQIVLGHGGTVTAEDREGGGTRVRVLLPLRGGNA